MSRLRKQSTKKLDKYPSCQEVSSSCRAICPQVSSYLSNSNEHSGGATLGPKGALAPPKYLKKLVYIYSRVILIKKCYIHNIFTINLKWQVIIGCYMCAKKLFKLWIKIRTNNNLPLRIYCEIVVKILWR